MVGVECNDLRRREWLSVGKLPLNSEDRAVDLAFLHNPTLANVLLIHPRRKHFGQLKHKCQLLACGIFAQDEGEGTPAERIAFVWFVILQGKPFAFPGTELGPAHRIRAPPVFAILVIPDGFREPQGGIFED